MDRSPTHADLIALASQLGRTPRGVVGIAVTCPYGYPQVVTTHPLLHTDEGIRPFPSLFWLTCPFLMRAVGRLEAAGGVRKMETKLRRDPDLARAYASAAQRYRGERNALLTPAELRELRARGMEGLLAGGVAGLGNPLRVKCLHAQLAHFLARDDNPVGKQVAENFPELACAPGQVICAQPKVTTPGFDTPPHAA